MDEVKPETTVLWSSELDREIRMSLSMKTWPQSWVRETEREKPLTHAIFGTSGLRKSPEKGTDIFCNNSFWVYTVI